MYVATCQLSAVMAKGRFNYIHAFNAVCGRIGTSGVNEVISPCLLYALEACPVNTSSSAVADKPARRAASRQTAKF